MKTKESIKKLSDLPQSEQKRIKEQMINKRIRTAQLKTEKVEAARLKAGLKIARRKKAKVVAERPEVFTETGKVAENSGLTAKDFQVGDTVVFEAGSGQVSKITEKYLLISTVNGEKWLIFKNVFKNESK
jgi:co-chaperonin GroES (HSP10)